ncbi:hypothetical protein ACFWBB_26015 [Streptomyces sp. NPDC060000]|uniref:hypothetical protein n=1 Tax=Streptomyces sp. NPDC060000 TaxID=3347031 RepID=UPI0036B8634E
MQEQIVKCGTASLSKLPKIVELLGPTGDRTLKFIKGFNSGYAVAEDERTGQMYKVYWDVAELADLALRVPFVTCLRIGEKVYTEAIENSTEVPSNLPGLNTVGPVTIQQAPGVQPNPLS